MTPFSVADGARLLGIHPKTLCHWLKQATIPLAAHPADARIKCVTQADLHQVASLHGRPLQSSVLGDPASPASVSSEAASSRLRLNMKKNQLPQLVCSPSPTHMKQPRSTDWLPWKPRWERFRNRLPSLRWRCSKSESDRSSSASWLWKPSCTHWWEDTSPPCRLLGMSKKLLVPGVCRDLCIPFAQLARSRMPPLIEYSASGIYVIISSEARRGPSGTQFARVV
jgi:hypothetical protein